MGRRPACPPNTKGWRAPWRGTWGPSSDGRSRLSRRGKEHEQDVLEEFALAAPTRLQRGRAKRYGKLMARADMIEALIGLDPTATVRRMTPLLKLATAERRALKSLVARNGHRDPLVAIRHAVEQANRA